MTTRLSPGEQATGDHIIQWITSFYNFILSKHASKTSVRLLEDGETHDIEDKYSKDALTMYVIRRIPWSRYEANQTPVVLTEWCTAFDYVEQQPGHDLETVITRPTFEEVAWAEGCCGYGDGRSIICLSNERNLFLDTKESEMIFDGNRIELDEFWHSQCAKLTIGEYYPAFGGNKFTIHFDQANNVHDQDTAKKIIHIMDRYGWLKDTWQPELAAQAIDECLSQNDQHLAFEDWVARLLHQMANYSI